MSTKGFVPVHIDFAQHGAAFLDLVVVTLSCKSAVLSVI